MALFKVLRGTAATIAPDSVTKPPFNDGYAYFTPDDGRFYIDVQLDKAPTYYYDSGVVNGKTIYRIEIESQTWQELITTKSYVGHHHRVSDIDDFHDTTYTVDIDSGLSMDGTEIAINNVPVSKGGTGQSTLASGQVLVGNGTSPVTTRPIDNTNGGTADSTALITSGAVEAGLATKSNVGHHHDINEIDDIAFTGTYNKTTNKIVTQDTLNSAIDEIDAESLGLSKAMRFIGKATVVISDGDKTDPVITGYDFGTNGANAKLGDVIIDKDGLYEYIWTADGWELLGGDSSYVVSGSKIKYTPTGTISPNPPTFTGSSKSISVSGTPTGSVTVNIGTNVSGTAYTPAGSVGQPTFTGNEAKISMSGTPTGTVTITSADATGTDAGNYTPKGSVSQPTFTGTPVSWNIDTTPSGSVSLSITDNTSGNYQPKGAVSQPTFTGTEGNISVSGTPTGTVALTIAEDDTNGNYTPTGTVSQPTFTGTATTLKATPTGSISVTATANNSGNYQPSGTVSQPSFTGTAATIVVSGRDGTVTYTPAGSVSKPNITVTPTTGKTYSITGVGSVPSLSMAVTDETLTYSWSAGSVPTREEKTFMTGATAALAAAPAFSGTGTRLTASYTPAGSVSQPTFTGNKVQLGGTFSGSQFSISYTPAGTISTPTFTGKKAKITPTFTGSALTSTGKFTPAGTVSKPTFTGTKVQITPSFSGTESSETIEYTPAGTVSKPTFTGTKARISGSFTGSLLSLSTDYTPTGSVSKPSWTGTQTKIGASFTGSALTSTGSYKPEGTISELTFVGTQKEITLTAGSVN